MKKALTVLTAVLMAAMLIVSCDNKPKGYTVTFDSTGGSEVSSQLVEIGGKATVPENPTHTGWGLLRWSTTKDGTEAFDFEKTEITGDITLYAVWKTTYAVGDVGPSGGVIYYDVDADNGAATNDGLTSAECGWRYLETLSGELSSTYKFSTKSSGSFDTKTGLGEGKTNTEKKLVGEEFPAATICADYSKTTDSGIKYDDWFLPSIDELTKLITSGISSEKLKVWSSGLYVSSSEAGGNKVYAYYGTSKDTNNGYDGNFRVFPVRRF